LVGTSKSQSSANAIKFLCDVCLACCVVIGWRIISIISLCWKKWYCS